MRTVLITGGSRGIGLELSRLLATAGDRLLWVAATQEELDAGRAELPAATIHCLALDLSEPDAADRVWDWTQDNAWDVDLLINNAGFGTYGWMDSIDLEHECAMLGLHVRTLYRLTRLFLDPMIQRGRGGLLFLSSASAFQPMPRFATYAASKAFILQFGESLHEELRARRLDIACTVVCPPATNATGFKSGAGMERVRTFESFMAVTPDVVARAALAGLAKNRPRVVPGFWTRVLTPLNILTPRWFLARAVARELDELPAP